MCEQGKKFLQLMLAPHTRENSLPNEEDYPLGILYF
jgi:hypothetical protein